MVAKNKTREKRSRQRRSLGYNNKKKTIKHQDFFFLLHMLTICMVLASIEESKALEIIKQMISILKQAMEINPNMTHGPLVS